MQKKIIKLVNTNHETVLVGTESIISAEWFPERGCTKIESRGAMIKTNWVLESPEEIWEQINSTI